MQTGTTPANADFANLNPYYEQIADAIGHLPGVEAASYSQMGPANEFESFSQVSRSSIGKVTEAVDETVAPSFFRVAGMHVLSGRDFRWSDLQSKQPLAVISESLAKAVFGKSDPIGQTISIGPASSRTDLTVIGVVNSARLWKVESVAPKAVYSLFGQRSPEYEPLLDVRAVADPEKMKPMIERVIRGLRYHESIRSMTVEERLDTYITVQRITALIAAFFGGLALLIAAIGVYGLTSYNVASRSAELGIRSALGAQKQDLVSLALKESLLLAAIGCSGGLVGTLMITRWIRALVFGVSPSSPLILGSVLVCLMGVTFLAAIRPAWRAATIDPMATLRLE